jgi:hypothetical protein
MIYSRFGCHLKITGYCGKHQPKGYAAPVMLVRAIREDDQATRHYFAHALKADDGLNEIEAAIDAAPEITLTKADLAKAIEQAM